MSSVTAATGGSGPVAGAGSAGSSRFCAVSGSAGPASDASATAPRSAAAAAGGGDAAASASLERLVEMCASRRSRRSSAPVISSCKARAPGWSLRERNAASRDRAAAISAVRVCSSIHSNELIAEPPIHLPERQQHQMAHHLTRELRRCLTLANCPKKRQEQQPVI